MFYFVNCCCRFFLLSCQCSSSRSTWIQAHTYICIWLGSCYSVLLLMLLLLLILFMFSSCEKCPLLMLRCRLFCVFCWLAWFSLSWYVWACLSGLCSLPLCVRACVCFASAWACLVLWDSGFRCLQQNFTIFYIILLSFFVVVARIFRLYARCPLNL